MASQVSLSVPSLVEDISGSPTPADDFVRIITNSWAHPPNSSEEAIALYRYVMKAEVEPAIEKILQSCVQRLSPSDQSHVKNVVTATVPVVKSRCC